MPSKSRYNPDYHDNWAWSLAVKGATNEEIAEAFGINVRTFIRWKERYESLAEAVDEGKNTADSNVERSLYQRAIGYTVTDTEKIVDMDKDGNVKPVRIKTTEKNIVPDVMAQMYWLNNRQRKHWSQKQEVDLTANGGKDDVIIYLPSDGRENDDE